MERIKGLLRNLRQRDIAIIVIVLTLAVGGLWYWFIYRSTLEDIADLRTDIERLNIEIQRGEAARRNLPELRLAVAQLEQDRLQFLSRLPRSNEVGNLFAQLQSAAVQAGVSVPGLTSPAVTSGQIQDVRSLSFSINSVGTFSQTMDFLQALEGLQRFTRIQTVSVSGGQVEGLPDPILDASYNFTVFVFTGRDGAGN